MIKIFGFTNSWKPAPLDALVSNMQNLNWSNDWKEKSYGPPSSVKEQFGLGPSGDMVTRPRIQA